MIRSALVLAVCLAVAGCVTTGTTTCPPGASLPKDKKAAAARAYRKMDEAERAAVGSLVEFIDRIERTCAAIARAR